MRQEAYILFTLLIALVGVAICCHLIFFPRKNISAKMLGWYTLLLTTSSVEPLKQFLGSARLFLEVVIGVAAFMIGPVLFLYCKYRLLDVKFWKKIDALHFIPAGMVFVLMFTASSAKPVEESIADIIFYLIFICQLFTYTLRSFFLVWREKKSVGHEMLRERFHLPFIFSLVGSSFILFVYSFLSTLFGMNEAFHFKLSVQGLLTLVIMVIALLNAETLENHPLERKKQDAIWRK